MSEPTQNTVDAPGCITSPVVVAVMDALTLLKSNVFPKIEEKLGFDFVNYFLLITFVCSGFTKIAPPIHKVGYAPWPTLTSSKLLFVLIGVWEIVGIMLYHQKLYVPAYTMLLMFMGGVFSSITIINPKTIGAIVYALPTTVFLLYAANKHTDKAHQDIAQVSSNALILISVGYVIGFVLHAISPKDKKNAKAKQ